MIIYDEYDYSTTLLNDPIILNTLAITSNTSTGDDTNVCALTTADRVISTPKR